MHHLLIGYGYCGYHLAKLLLAQQQEVTALSRHLDPSLKLPGLTHLAHDLAKPLIWQQEDSILYYLIPPPEEGNTDRLLQHFLAHSDIQALKVIYFGSSGIYGNHRGAWVDEQAPCYLDKPRQKRRANAEEQWRHFCQQQEIDCILLRIAGIYGPKRIPSAAARAGLPLINPEEAPYSNTIYVKDLVNIAYQLACKIQVEGIYNIADGNPSPMGSLQQALAKELNLKPAPYQSFEQAWEQASSMKREFMEASKRLRIDALKITLGQLLHLTPLPEAIRESLEEGT